MYVKLMCVGVCVSVVVAWVCSNSEMESQMKVRFGMWTRHVENACPLVFSEGQSSSGGTGDRNLNIFFT